MKDELKSSKNKMDKLERDYIALTNNMSDKPLSEYQMAFLKFVNFFFNRTKVASMIYGLSRSKGECLGLSEQFVDLKSEIWIKSTKLLSPSSAQKDFLHALYLLMTK